MGKRNIDKQVYEQYLDATVALFMEHYTAALTDAVLAEESDPATGSESMDRRCMEMIRKECAKQRRKEVWKGTNLNDCTDIIVVMSDSTRHSQWVPFEVGMSAQKDMPTATFLQENVSLPDFLAYWPRLKQPSDIRKYIAARNEVQHEYVSKYLFESFKPNQSQTERFYDVLKQRL